MLSAVIASLSLFKPVRANVPTVAFWAGTGLYQLLDDLTFMHDHGIAHGDIRETSYATSTIFALFLLPVQCSKSLSSVPCFA
ncbi:hypothetical protein C8R44DRAFT_821752 [Mycena epipterygia]|nr:hypothetical protein C8R44DRAFT_821752 [Mycena epipterygia]